MATRIANPSSQMRKQPRQARSHATIEAILHAAAHILGERGWQGLTTNAVADLAGVSIGSLYQYFPNKLALIEGVRQRHFDDVLGALRAAIEGEKPARQRITAFVDGMIAAHARHPATHRVLLEDAPRGAASKPTHEAFEASYLTCYESLIAAVNPHSSGDDRTRRARVLSSALAGAIHDAARRGSLQTPRLRQELIELVAGYLKMK